MGELEEGGTERREELKGGSERMGELKEGGTEGMGELEGWGN